MFRSQLVCPSVVEGGLLATPPDSPWLRQMPIEYGRRHARTRFFVKMTKEESSADSDPMVIRLNRLNTNNEW